MKGRSILSLEDLAVDEIEFLLDLATRFGTDGIPAAHAGRTVCGLFFNPSMRTRTALEIAAPSLGAHPVIHDVRGNAVVGHGLELVTAGPFEISAITVPDLEIERRAGYQGEHNVLVEDAVATEHGATPDLAQGCEQLHDMHFELSVCSHIIIPRIV